LASTGDGIKRDDRIFDATVRIDKLLDIFVDEGNGCVDL
jgi:hypothetical protein